MLLQIFWKKVLQKCFWSSPLPTIWILSKSLILIGCHGNRKAKFSRKILKNLLLRSRKSDDAEICINVHDSSLYINYIFIVVAHVLSLLWQSFHILIMGKVEIGIYFCVTADILTNILLKCFWSSPLPTICILSKSLILIGFLACNLYSILAEYSLHSCTFRWALWPMGLWFY